LKVSRAVGILAAIATLSWRAIAGKPLRSHSGGRLVQRIASDQRRIWSFPVTAAHGKGFRPALAVAGATGALIAIEPRYVRWLQRPAYQNQPVVRAANRLLTAGKMALLINAIPWSFYVGGFLFRNSYAWRTGLLAGEAAANAEIVAIAMKHVDRRMRPIEVGPDGDFTRTWFRTKNHNLDGAGCFPSGHTSAAFAVAAVFAGRYRSGWVGWAAYGVAGIIGLSRMSARAHYPSDVFFGAALGYSIGHFVVIGRPPAVSLESRGMWPD
jgi:membrane-associated phospholipid phosphatase